MIVRGRIVLKRTDIGDWRFEHLSGRQGQTQQQTGSSLQDQLFRLPGFLHCWDWQKPWLLECLTYSTNFFQRLPLEIWCTNLEQTPLNRCQPLPTNDWYTTQTKPTNGLLTDQFNLTNDRRMKTDPRRLMTNFYTSLWANTMMTKLTNQFQRTRLITSSTDKYCSLDSRTWLWRWPPLRLSKRQSVLFRTLTRTITLYELLNDTPGFKPFTVFLRVRSFVYNSTNLQVKKSCAVYIS